jgi:hypothetical protein
MQTHLTTPQGETLFQIAFVPRDIRASMRVFTERLGVGPWLRERGVFPVQFYRDESTGVALAVGMGYAPASAIQYELIEQLDELPSIFKDVIAKSGYGFHHYGVMTEDFDASFSRYRVEGYAPIYEAEVPAGALPSSIRARRLAA